MVVCQTYSFVFRFLCCVTGYFDFSLGFDTFSTSDRILEGLTNVPKVMYVCLGSGEILTLVFIFGIQQVGKYFRGTGKAADLKRQAAAGAFRSAI